jgi:hypothetical protein
MKIIVRQGLRSRGRACFAAHAPGAEIHLPDGGYFVLEKHTDAAAGSAGYRPGQRHRDWCLVPPTSTFVTGQTLHIDGGEPLT